MENNENSNLDKLLDELHEIVVKLEKESGECDYWEILEKSPKYAKYINWDGLTNDELVKILILYPWAVDYCDLKKFTDDNFKNILKGLDSRLKNK